MKRHMISNSSQIRGPGLDYVGAGNMYKLWGQSSCSVHSHNIIKQYMHTVAYMVLHAQDTLPDLSIGALGDNCYLPNTL